MCPTYILLVHVFIVGVGSTPPHPDEHDSGRIVLKHSMAFNLIARPTVVVEEKVLIQPYNISYYHNLYWRLGELAKQVRSTCDSAPTTDWSGEEVIEQEEPLFQVKSNVEQSWYQARRICKEANQMLPEPTSEADFQSLSQIIRSRGIRGAFLGAVFDDKTGLYRYEHRGRFLGGLRPRYDEKQIVYYGAAAGANKNWKEITLSSCQGTLGIYHWFDGKSIRGTFEGDDPRTMMYPYRNNHYNEWLKKRNYRESIEFPVVCQRLDTWRSNRAARIQPTRLIMDKLKDQVLSECDSAVKDMSQGAERAKNEIQVLYRAYGLMDTSGRQREPRNVQMVLGAIMGGFDLWQRYALRRDLVRNADNIRVVQDQVAQHAKVLEAYEAEAKQLRARQEAVEKDLANLREEFGNYKKWDTLRHYITGATQLALHMYLHLEGIRQEVRHVLHEVRVGLVPAAFQATLSHKIEGMGLPLEYVTPHPVIPVFANPEMTNHLIEFSIVIAIGEKTWDLYELTPLPQFDATAAYYVETRYKYVLIDQYQERFVPLDDKQVKECLTGVCVDVEIARRILDERCTINSFIGVAPDPNCPMRRGDIIPYFKRVRNQIVFSVPHEMEGRLVCSDPAYQRPGSDGTVAIRGTGIIQIPYGCNIKLNAPDITVYGSPYRTKDEHVMVTIGDNTESEFRLDRYIDGEVDELQELRQSYESLNEHVDTSLVKRRTVLILIGVTSALVAVILLFGVWKGWFFLRYVRRLKQRYCEFKRYVQEQYERADLAVRGLARLMRGVLPPRLRHLADAAVAGVSAMYTSSEYKKLRGEQRQSTPDANTLDVRAWASITGASADADEREKPTPRERREHLPPTYEGHARNDDEVKTKEESGVRHSER